MNVVNKENLSFNELKEIFKDVEPNLNTLLVVPAVVSEYHDKKEGSKMFKKSDKEIQNDSIKSFITEGSMIIAVGDNVRNNFPNLRPGRIAFMSEHAIRETVVMEGECFALTILPHVISYTKDKR